MLRYFLNEYFTVEFFLLSLVRFILDHYHSFIKCMFSTLESFTSQRLVNGYHIQMYSWTGYHIQMYSWTNCMGKWISRPSLSRN